jgi:uncharacterized protein (TIGR03437 family)
VDPDGGVYLELELGESNAPVTVEKLSADGASVLWRTQLTVAAPDVPPTMAVDSTGRVFAVGAGSTGGVVVRLNAAGAIDTTFSNLPGILTAISVDPTGSDIVVAFLRELPDWGFARLAADGATWASFTPPHATEWPALAVAVNGDAVVYGGLNGNWFLQRIDPAGTAVFSQTLSEVNDQPGQLALDAAGNAYIVGNSGGYMHPVVNSLAPCGSTWLSVYSPDGSLLQSTYLTGSVHSTPSLAVGPNPTVFLVLTPDATFAHTQSGPFAQSLGGALLSLDLDAATQTVPLACVGNAATFATGAVAPGEIVTLFGNGLGPQQGVQLTASLQGPFPTRADNVEVTFDGEPAPLLWVQDAQINLAVPWSVAGPATEVCAANLNVQTSCLTWPVAEAAPGVFTVDGTYAAALNQDGTVNSAANPAQLNSIVSIFATGLGPISPPQADGSLVELPLPVNTLPLTLAALDPVCIGEGVILPPFCPTVGYSAAYAGPAPFLIAGASQVNFNAGDVANGFYLTVRVASGTASSNTVQIYLASQ